MVFLYKITTMTYNFNFENKNKKEKEKNTLKEKSFYVIPERGADPIDITEYSYNKNSGQLFTRRPGSFIIEVMVPPILDEITFDDYEFMDLILGLYLMYVGSVRKGFSLTDLPFDNDGGDLYENGKTLYEEAIARLQESDGSWYNAIL
jgi:hypothetical protein